ncbi:hypothetical protein ACGFNV_01335 [Streptomyces sp. NPDC048751]|uniref:hypothetical protein n=1 Tax=Streptomyces sp. NPDC048751 TaxID=3365591 RepID=UPI00371B88A0
MTDLPVGEVQPNVLNRRRVRIPADALVLAGHPVRPRVRLSETSRFSDDTWFLKHAQTQNHQSEFALNFLRIPAAFRTVAKEFWFTLLRGDLPPGCEAIRNIDSIRGYLTELKVAFK